MWGNAQKGGIDRAVPDVCKTPPLAVPIPYVNIGNGPLGVPPSPTVFYECTPAHNLGTIIPVTTGDEPGVIGGVASGKVVSPSIPITGANTVLLNGLPATRLTTLTHQNTGNIIGTRIAPSQTTVLILAP